MHLVLSHDLRVVALALHGHNVGERIRRDHDSRRVDRILSTEALEASRRLDHLTRDRIGVVELAETRCGLIVIALALRRLTSRINEALRQRRILAEDRGRHQLRSPIPDAVRMSKDTGGVADRLFPLDRRERDDLRDVVGSVALGAVLDHLAAIPLVEVHVDIRHLATTWIQEPLEDQSVRDRVQIRDLEAVGHDRAGGAATSGSGADPPLAGVSDEIPHDEEVGREPHLGDDPELILQPLRDRVVQIPVPLLRLPP